MATHLDYDCIFYCVFKFPLESVLRYGLPVDFTSVLYKVHSGKEHLLTQKLDKSLGNGAADDLDEGEEYHDFVLLKFEP